MLLERINVASSAPQRLNFYLPVYRGSKRVYTDERGEFAVTNTPDIFGTNRHNCQPLRGRRLAMLDAAQNHLVQQTHDYDLSCVLTAEFAEAFLSTAVRGDTLPQEQMTAWINHRIARINGTNAFHVTLPTNVVAMPTTTTGNAPVTNQDAHPAPELAGVA